MVQILKGSIMGWHKENAYAGGTHASTEYSETVLADVAETWIACTKIDEVAMRGKTVTISYWDKAGTAHSYTATLDASDSSVEVAFATPITNGATPYSCSTNQAPGAGNEIYVGVTGCTATAANRRATILVTATTAQWNYLFSNSLRPLPMKKGTFKLPWCEPALEEYHEFNSDVDDVLVINRGYEYEDGEQIYYLQNLDFVKLFLYSVGTITNATAGQQVQSFSYFLNNLLRRYEIFGNQIRELHIRIKSGTWAEISIIPICHSVKDSDSGSVADLTLMGFIKPSCMAPMHSGNFTITVGGSDIRIIDMDLMLKNKFDEEDYENNKYVNKDKRQKPLLMKLDCELDLTFLTSSTTFADYKLSTTVETVDVAIPIAFTTGTETITLNNMYAQRDSININQIPESDIYEYAMKLKKTDTFSIVLS